MTTTTITLWRYDDPLWADLDLVGYSVEALDGSIGKIDEASTEVGARYLVVDTGPWIFGKKVMLPAGIVDGVDTRNERVYVDEGRDRERARVRRGALPGPGVSTGAGHVLRASRGRVLRPAGLSRRDPP